MTHGFALFATLLAIAGSLAAGAAIATEAKEIHGTVKARREGALRVDFTPSADVAPQVGDTVVFATDIQGITVDAGQGEVVEIAPGAVWVRVVNGRPDLEMTAAIRATGTVNVDAVLDQVRKRAEAGDCGPDMPAMLRPFAEAGNPRAQNNLGAAYIEGCGVPVDREEGTRWIRRAAEQGLAIAQFNLAKAHAVGSGVPVDEKEAARWTRRAAEQGLAPAQSYLSMLYYQARGVPRDDAQVFLWAQRSAEQGYAEGLARLAHCYWMGIGVRKDAQKAEEVRVRASAAGWKQ